MATLLSQGMSASLMAPGAGREAAIPIGSRLELMVDDFLIERLEGGARQVLHHPIPREVVLVHDAPWEGSGCNYYSVFCDGDLYRMYYHGWQLGSPKGAADTPHPLVTCYAESRDGIHWEKPSLGLVEYEGSRANNIVLATGELDGVPICAGHIALCKDENPDAAPEARYKALAVSWELKGLIALGSPDGFHWRPLSKEPVITKGAFDSQNLAFWDSARGEYRAYVRFFDGGCRGILTATSPDFLHWTEPLPLEYPGTPKEQLYTNQVKPYHRAPHLLLGFPTRYVERGWSPSMEALPELEHRRLRSRACDRYGMALTEGLFMSSRDGRTFRRWGEAFLRPGPERPDTWNYGHQYIAWHPVETAASLPGAANELSLYATESYWTGTYTLLRRYTLRLDGFVSVNAPLSGGAVLTKPIRFEGSRLWLNFSTSAAGAVRVEIQDASGAPIPGFALADCHETFGDSIERPVVWKRGSDVSALAGRAVRLRFELSDADLYAFRFR
ncbi:MAG TPA: hypothetical protein PLU39_07020 [Armatimonadota bacterium]|jgi:hypothetical protein|nr:hypothetical protein [Armatimonadota bacterium]HOM82424.1 hypothetical protein [Armatimonadota bacterium]HPO71254.1 hypothetical protein [Armatimonadota bacterium]HPT97605.1 hypothetical protein [Armatimonadota bacterium]